MKNWAAIAALIGGTVALVLGMSAATCLASTGTFSYAFASPDWKQARFAFTGSADPCLPIGACSYFATVTVVPSLPEYSQCRDVALDTDRNTQGVYTGPVQYSNGPIAGENTNAFILPGVYGQRLCLSLVVNREEVDIVCEAEKRTIEEFTGRPAAPCPLKRNIFEERLASELLTIEPPAPVPPPAAAPQPPPAKTPSGPKRPHCRKSQRLTKKHGRYICVHRAHHRHPSHRGHHASQGYQRRNAQIYCHTAAQNIKSRRGISCDRARHVANRARRALIHLPECTGDAPASWNGWSLVGSTSGGIGIATTFTKGSESFVLSGGGTCG